MNGGSLSDTQRTMVLPLLQETNIIGKPYITVSAKGIVNGLSRYPNDGADFGPDTTLGATAPGQYGSPYTETSAIQETISYAYNKQQKIFMTNGVFNVTASFKAYPAGTSYGQILLPYNPSPNGVPPTPNPMFIEIEGFGGIYGDVNGSGTTDGLPVPTGGTVIYFQPPSTPSSSTVGEYSGIDGGDQTISNYVILRMNRVTLRQNPSPQFANMQLSALANVDLDRIRNDIYYSINATTSSTLPPISTSPTGVGIVYLDNNGINNRAWGSYRNISAVGYYYGHAIQPSANVLYSNIYSLFCEYGLYVVGDTTGNQISIYNFTAQFCAYSIYAVNPSTGSYKLNVSIHNYISIEGSNYVTSIDGPAGTTGFIEFVSASTPSPPTGNASGINVVYNRTGGPYISTTAGTSAGTIGQLLEIKTNYYQKYIFIINGYENDTTTNQTIDFYYGFYSFASITANTTGLTITATTSGITITAPNSTTTYSGIVIVEGY